MNWNKLLNPKRIRDLFEGGGGSRLPDEHRTEFDKDYGRAVFSTPVRRLQDKAQVFPLERHDAVRTRLTHSNEVSSVARGLADAAATWMLAKGLLDNAEQVKSITAISATCGLIHDLGNPPFGHAGETSIKNWFDDRLKEDPKFFDSIGGPKTQEAQDFLQFQGNAQTQRLLSRLQVMADLYGLNLTCGTLSASCKYIAKSNQRDESRHEHSETGFFSSENDLIDKIRDETGTGIARNPITYLVEAADDIVYSTVDLEDGIKKGVLTWDELENKEMFKDFKGDDGPARRAFKAAHDKIDGAKFFGNEHDDAMAQSFRTNAIYEMVKATLEAFKNHYAAIMEGHYHRELWKDSSAAGFIRACKRIGRDKVYVSNETLKLEVYGNIVIRGLLTLFWQGVQEFESNPKGIGAKMYKLTSPNYRYVFDNALKKARSSSMPELYVKLQLVTDQVCGMTDTLCLRFIQRTDKWVTINENLRRTFASKLKSFLQADKVIALVEAKPCYKS
jgi:dGTPase